MMYGTINIRSQISSLKPSGPLYAKTSIYFSSMVVVVMVYIILSGQVRHIPNHDSAILHTVSLDSDLYHLFLILNVLTFLVRNNQPVRIKIYRFITL